MATARNKGPARFPIPTFRATKSGPRIVYKKGMYLTFYPGISLKGEVFFPLSFLGLMGNLKRGLEDIPYTINMGYIEQCSGFRGVAMAGKAREKPAKGGFRNIGRPEMGGAFKGGNEHMRTLNSTECGGGGAYVFGVLTELPAIRYRNVNRTQL